MGTFNPDFAAVNSSFFSSSASTYFTLVGASGGNITISSGSYTNPPSTAVGSSEVQLNFTSPLPDDTYTLTVADSLENGAGTALDGLGTGVAGSGNYTVTFTVQGGLVLATQLTGGIQTYDLNSASQVTNTVAPFSGLRATDTVFAGNFVDPSTGTADGYSKLAAYGLSGGQYRFLFQTESGAVQTVVSPVQTPGLPVAGEFYGVTGTGDDVGIFTGTQWYLMPVSLSNGLITLGTPTVVNWSAFGGPKGEPVVGDFSGVGTADLAVFSNGNFYVSFGANKYDEIDTIVPLSFPGAARGPWPPISTGPRTRPPAIRSPIWACGCPAPRFPPPPQPTGTSCPPAGPRSMAGRLPSLRSSTCSEVRSACR